MKIEQLMKECIAEKSCINCKKKKACEEFKRIAQNMIGPFELRILLNYDYSERESNGEADK